MKIRISATSSPAAECNWDIPTTESDQLALKISVISSNRSATGFLLTSGNVQVGGYVDPQFGDESSLINLTDQYPPLFVPSSLIRSRLDVGIQLGNTPSFLFMASSESLSYEVLLLLDFETSVSKACSPNMQTNGYSLLPFVGSRAY